MAADAHDLAAHVAAGMPQLQEELASLVAIPGISEWDFPEHTRARLLEAHEALIPLFRDAGVGRISSLELPNTAPILTGEIPAPDGAPTVLLYGHYDVVPAEAWTRAEDEINRTGTLRFAAFALPWVLDGADPRSAAVITGSIPLPLRLLQRLVWARSYGRASMLG